MSEKTFKANDAVKALRLISNFTKVLQPLQEICELASTLDSDIEQKQGELTRLIDRLNTQKGAYDEEIQRLKEEAETWKSGLAKTKAECVDEINKLYENRDRQKERIEQEISTGQDDLHNFRNDITVQKIDLNKEIEIKKLEYDDVVSKVRLLKESIWGTSVEHVKVDSAP